jgi:hypothetical protein
MATTQADIVSQMKAALLASMPEMDTSIGTPAGKILDALGASIADAYVDNHLLTYTYDIDSKTDADLDAFVQLFGIARLPAKRASGTVTFTRASTDAATTITFIPINTQITSSTETPIIVQTVTGAVMNTGVLSITVPVLAVSAGPSGNVGANLLNNLSTPVAGVSAVTNLSALNGGVDQETDTALRARWKATVFRNLAGTESMFLGIALDDQDCFAANVVTAAKQVREQIQISGTSATSTVNDAKYVFGTPITFGTDIDNGVVFVQGHDYNFNPSIPPSVTVLNSTVIPDGTVADLMYQYTPVMSRSDPSNGIINRVDLWCGGTRAIAASQAMVFNNSKTFGTTGLYNRTNFVRSDGVTNPASGNIFIPLAFGPIVTVSSTITIGTSTYGLVSATNAMGTTDAGGIKYAYQIVHDNTANGWTPMSLFGLEWSVAAGYVPVNNTAFTMGADGAYTFNQVPTSIQQAIDSWRLAGTDARAHQATLVRLKFSLAVMYDRGAYPPQVNQAMDSALGTWLTSLGINSVVQISDALQTLHNVPGVNNVRFLNGADNPGFTSGAANSYQVGVQQISPTGAVTQSYVDTTGRPKDIVFTDSQIPQFGASHYVQKSQNSFGSY